MAPLFARVLTTRKKMMESLEKPAAVTEVKTLESEERQTIVHCTCGDDYAYRIWPSTFLIEKETGRRAKLITAFNISFAPQWTLNDGKGFTLIFEGLSKSCSVFDLKEIIPQEGGFEVNNLQRKQNRYLSRKFLVELALIHMAPLKYIISGLLVAYSSLVISQTKPASFFYQEGVKAAHLNKYPAADSLFTLSLNIQPHPDAYFNRAAIRLRLGNQKRVL